MTIENSRYKFRAWDQTHEKMSEWSEDNNFAEYENDHISILISNPVKHVILMQYTGCKDKNEKEIYEGDIVEYKTASKKELFVSRNIIKFYKGCFRYYNLVHGSKGACLSIDCGSFAGNVEIIGNIYKNPELLGG